MNRIIVDDTAKTQFLRALEPCEVVDSAGNKLGYFLRELDPALYEGLEPPFSEEELRHASEEEGGRPLADILADLEGRK